MGGDQTAFLEAMAEAGKAVSDYLGDGKRIVCVNVTPPPQRPRISRSIFWFDTGDYTMDEEPMKRRIDWARKVVEQVIGALLGKEAAVREVMLAFLAGGHVLLEDIPGVGKTTLALTFSRAMALECKRCPLIPAAFIRRPRPTTAATPTNIMSGRTCASTGSTSRRATILCRR